MAASNLNPWESAGTTGPYRPGLADFRGAVLENKVRPANNNTPDADSLNNAQRVAVSVSSVSPAARIVVQGSSAALLSVASTNSNVTLASSTFTITRNAAGDWSIDYVADGTNVSPFPAPAFDPRVSCADSAVFAIMTTYFDASPPAGKRRIHVKAIDRTGAAVDCRFMLDIP